jgi:putative IMPACT (imprinted ancient) family translation regulator
MPVLDVIRKNGCTDIVVVVTRYFGGTLLGTGGLVKAYTSAAVGSLEAAQIITYDIYTELKIEVSYSDFQKFAPIFADCEFRCADTRYTDKIVICGTVRKNNLENLTNKLVQTSAGRVKIEIIDEKFDF